MVLYKKRKPSAMSRALVKKTRSSRPVRKGLRQEQLPGDGSTWTLEMAVPRSRFSIESQSFRMLQSYSIQSWFTTSTSNPTFTNVSLSFNQIDQYAALAAVFDQYKINAVEVFITPQASASIASDTGIFYSVIDLDDSTNLTTTGQAQDYASCVIAPCKTGVLRRFIPRVAVALYAPSAFTSFGNSKPVWIDTSSPAVTHYGVKVASTATITHPVVYDLYIRYDISFKSVR